MKPRIWPLFCQGISFSVITGSICIKSRAQLLFEVELYYMYIQVHAFNNEIIFIELSIPGIMSFIFRVLCTQASPQLSRKLILVTPQVC